MNLQLALAWSEHHPIFIVDVLMLYGVFVELIRCIAVAKGYDARNWLLLALVFPFAAAVAVAALPNCLVYQRICEIRDAARAMAKGGDGG
ncbi:MAG: hypothetical protein CBD15_003605 [Synechococcus sp. TMED155]|nr:MAG: hypothetical protein CBD15_003605 [Synechococcus sp. TMED155]